MNERRTQAMQEFRRMVRWIAGIAVVMTAAAILYLVMTGDVTVHMVVATLGGVFLSVMLGCGLMAAAFFSDKSGHDRSITDATKSKPNERD